MSENLTDQPTNEPDTETSIAPVQPAPEPIGYDLTPGEQIQFHGLNTAVMNQKLVVYNLNAALETALKEVDAAQERFTGALQFLAGSHGMGACRITEGFTRIFPLGGK